MSGLPVFSRPTRDEVVMAHARLASSRGTCSRLQVGAVASRDGRVLLSGYNGAPAGMPHCYHADDSPCVEAVHAEANVIAYAARWGISLEGADLFTTHSPCRICCQLIVNSGVVRVVYDVAFRETDGLRLLAQARIKVEHT